MLLSNAGGSSLSKLLSRARDSSASCVRCASVGDSWAACKALKERWFLIILRMEFEGLSGCR